MPVVEWYASSSGGIHGDMPGGHPEPDTEPTPSEPEDKVDNGTP